MSRQPWGSHLTEGHLLLADWTGVRQVLEGGGEVLVELHGFQDVQGLEVLALQGHQAPEQRRLLSREPVLERDLPGPDGAELEFKPALC